MPDAVPDGLEHRAARLAAARPDQAGAIAAAVRRLTDPGEMGTLFKALAIAPSTLAVPGFDHG